MAVPGVNLILSFASGVESFTSQCVPQLTKIFVSLESRKDNWLMLFYDIFDFTAAYQISWLLRLSTKDACFFNFQLKCL
ncbi:MAG: hypothetical protein DI539_05295 [Flavobacterium psychrophilum]|nr:MAG: hypothetical protein DI539_05295 [Flavobacterium psychrophilum]